MEAAAAAAAAAGYDLVVVVDGVRDRACAISNVKRLLECRCR